MKVSRLGIYKSPELILWLGVLFLALHCCDMFLTVKGIGMGGSEANPLLSWMGLQWMIAVKMSVALGIAMWIVTRQKYALAAFGCSMTGAIILWNLLQISGVI